MHWGLGGLAYMQCCFPLPFWDGPSVTQSLWFGALESSRSPLPHAHPITALSEAGGTTHSLTRGLKPDEQLERNHVVSTSWQEEALARHGVSREVPCSALKRLPDWASLELSPSVESCGCGLGPSPVRLG